MSTTKTSTTTDDALPSWMIDEDPNYVRPTPSAGKAPFISAEHGTSPHYGVWVMLRTFSVLVAGIQVPWFFEVTTSTGYRATLPACRRIIDGEHGKPCLRKIDDRGQHPGVSVDKWLDHIRTHCHSMHLEHAQAFRDSVQETYVQNVMTGV